MGVKKDLQDVDKALKKALADVDARKNKLGPIIAKVKTAVDELTKLAKAKNDKGFKEQLTKTMALFDPIQTAATEAAT